MGTDGALASGSDEEYAPLLGFVVDECAARQEYSQELKDLLQRIVQEQGELFAQRVKHVEKEQQRAREDDAARALLVL